MHQMQGWLERSLFFCGEPGGPALSDFSDEPRTHQGDVDMKGILTLTCAALLSTAAFAQTSPSGSGSVFDQFDTDHNGNISQAEANVNSTVMANFSTADTDHDGQLSKSEFDAAFRPANAPSEQPKSDTQSTTPSSQPSTMPGDMPKDQPTTPPPSSQPPEEAPPSTQPPQQ
jgi:Ca2+-binding EF-hand superfamily protein